MKTESQNRYSSLYYRLRLSRATIPPLASLGVILFEVYEHGVPFRPIAWTPVVDVLVFGIIGPSIAFLVLTWLLHRIRERDEAEARLAVVTAHERELLSRLERFVRAERSGLTPTLESILAAIITETSMTGGAIYLVRQTDGKLLRPTVSWPSPETGVLLSEVAQKAMPDGKDGGIGREGMGSDTLTAPDQRVLTVPITDHGETLGVLALCGATGEAPPDRGILGIVAGAMALLIRNNQLYARLESQAVMDERNELAREVHDSLAQSLGYLNFKAQQVKRLLDRGDLAAAGIALDELCEGSREVYEEVRVLIQSLRSSVGAVAGGLVSSIQQYSALLTKRTGLGITVDAVAEPSLPPEVQLQLFRVVQEALTNAHEHAAARHVLIRLDGGPDCVTLTIEDDGRGLAAPVPEEDNRDLESGSQSRLEPISDKHFGLRIMRERLQSIGGEMEVESQPEDGTMVRIRVPADCDYPVAP